MGYFTRVRKGNPNHDAQGRFADGPSGGASEGASAVDHKAIEAKLSNAIMQYDNKQSKRPGFNRYALPQYMRAVDDVMKDIKAGAPVRDAIVAAFNDRLAGALLRATGQTPYTREDAMGGGWSYTPASKKR